MKKETLMIRTSARTDFVKVSHQVQSALNALGVINGVCTLYVPHTTAGVFINEGYDPDVMRDVEYSLEQQIPWDNRYAHSEGNAAAHIKAILTGNSQQVLVENGKLLLGQWEEIFFAEFDGPQTRKLIVTCMEG
ncbi:MAG: secondary thiamine-phosphate synthase enzyme YjbQ [bacterium]|jgi:secondary thiamine-phosphate synthase enzyme